MRKEDYDSVEPPAPPYRSRLAVPTVRFISFLAVWGGAFGLLIGSWYWLMRSVGDDVGFWSFAVGVLERTTVLGPSLAFAALAITFVSLEQKRYSDEKTSYFMRLQWAIDKALSSDNPELRGGALNIANQIIMQNKLERREEPVITSYAVYLQLIGDLLEADIGPNEPLSGEASEEKSPSVSSESCNLAKEGRTNLDEGSINDEHDDTGPAETVGSSR